MQCNLSNKTNSKLRKVVFWTVQNVFILQDALLSYEVIEALSRLNLNTNSAPICAQHLFVRKTQKPCAISNYGKFWASLLRCVVKLTVKHTNVYKLQHTPKEETGSIAVTKNAQHFLAKNDCAVCCLIEWCSSSGRKPLPRAAMIDWRLGDWRLYSHAAGLTQ